MCLNSNEVPLNCVGTSLTQLLTIADMPEYVSASLGKKVDLKSQKLIHSK